ncbi:MAG: DUF423 domain-containing protein [Terrimicrobiaceae bacterium]
MKEPPLQLAAILGFSGVALGAFGAHGLRTILEQHGMSAVWQTAVLYHLVHAVAVLSAGAWRPWAARLWAAGILIFSGSLYILAVSGVRWLGAITPIGGVLLLAGWIALVLPPRLFSRSG